MNILLYRDELGMCLIDVLRQCLRQFIYMQFSCKMQCHNGHFGLGHSGAQQELIPGGLSYLLGGYVVVRVVVLNSLQVNI